MLGYSYSSGCWDAPRQGPASLSPSPKHAAPRFPSTCPGSSMSMLGYSYSSGCRDAPRQGPASSSPLPKLAAPQLPSTCPGSSTSMLDHSYSSGCRDALRRRPASSSPSPEHATSLPLSTDHHPHRHAAAWKRRPELHLCRLGVLHRRGASVRLNL